MENKDNIIINSGIDKYDIIMPKEIVNNIVFLVNFAKLMTNISKIKNKMVYLNFLKTIVFDEEMTAIISIIIEELINNNNSGAIINFNKNIREIWKENGFIKKNKNDKNDKIEFKSNTKNTVRFFKFKEEDLDNGIEEYLEKDIIDNSQINLSNGAKKELIRNFIEIFKNAYEHGRCKELTCCGRYNESSKKLIFVIINRGKSFKDLARTYKKETLINLQKHNNLLNKKKETINYGDVETKIKLLTEKLEEIKDLLFHVIEWAIKLGNTTVQDSSRGMGLYQLTKFFENSKGQIIILSDNEFWKQDNNGKVSFKHIGQHLHGTYISFEFNLDDCNEYISSLEKQCNEDQKIIF